MSPIPNMANGWKTSITGAISNTDTTATCASILGIPDRPYQATLVAEGSNKDEVITVTGLTGSVITFSRATEAIADGTQVAQAHAAGATIEHRLTKQMLLDLAGSGSSGMTNPMTAGGDLIVGWNPTLVNVATPELGASCTQQGSNAPTLIDGNPATSIDVDNYGPVIVTLDKAYTVSEVHVYGGAYGDNISSLSVFYSTNGTDWTLVGGIAHTMAAQIDTWTIASTTAQYWKFVPSNKYWGLCSVEVRSADPAPGTPVALPVGDEGDVLTVADGSPAWGPAVGLVDEGAFTYFDMTGASAPGNPASSTARIYAKTDGRIYSRDSAGTEYGPFDAGGGGDAGAAYSDDFSASTLDGKWTQLGGSLLDVLDTTSTSNQLRMKSNSAGYAVYGVYETAPAGPFVAVAKIASWALASNYVQAGILLADSTPTALLAWGPLYGGYGAAVNDLAFGYWTSRTVRSWCLDNNIVTSAPLWLGITYFGSKLHCSYSLDGSAWIPFGSTIDSPFTISRVGLFVAGNTAGGSAEAYFEYIKVWPFPS